jgi:hypothetical protein
MVQLINPAKIATGDISVTLEPATADTQQTEFGQILEDTTKVIAAGAYSVEVHNTGNEEITVNGFKVEPNDRYLIKSEYNQVTNKVDFCPIVTVITPVGGFAYFVAFRPSA